MNNHILSGDIISPVHTRVQYLIELDRFDDAEKQANRFLEKKPEDCNMLGLLCKIKIGQGSVGKALEFADKSLKANPVCTNLYRLKSETLAELEYHQAAIESSLIAVALEPEDSFLHQDLGRHRFNLAVEQTEEEEQLRSFCLAREDFKKAIELSGGDAYLYMMLGCVEMALKNWSNAETALEQALELDVNSAASQFMRGKLCVYTKDWDGAKQYLSRSCEIDDRWMSEAKLLLLESGEFADGEEADDPSVWSDLLSGLTSLLKASLIAALPTLIFWMMIDALTGYFPPMSVALLSVPMAPLGGYVMYRLYLRDIKKMFRKFGNPKRISDSTKKLLNPS